MEPFAYDFVIRAFVAGLGVALVAAPLGTFVVWRRMAYFGDTLAHSALLGVALGFLIGINVTLGTAIVCLVIAVMLIVMRRQQGLSDDTLLGILAHSALSLGLVAIAFLETVRVDLIGYLFGDILAVTWFDIGIIFAGGSVVLGILASIWRPLLALTVHEDMARVEGVSVLPIQLAYMLLLAVVISFAMKIVGILLVTSLLIIPSAAARQFARSPEQMVIAAVVIGALAMTGGLAGSVAWDLPSGPAVVVMATALFALSGLREFSERRRDRSVAASGRENGRVKDP